MHPDATAGAALGKRCRQTACRKISMARSSTLATVVTNTQAAQTPLEAVRPNAAAVDICRAYWRRLMRRRAAQPCRPLEHLSSANNGRPDVLRGWPAHPAARHSGPAGRGSVPRHGRGHGELRHRHDAPPSDRAHAGQLAFLRSARHFDFFGDRLREAGIRHCSTPESCIHVPTEPRGQKFDTELADDKSRSGNQEQVEMRVTVRMACLAKLTRSMGLTEAG